MVRREREKKETEKERGLRENELSVTTFQKNQRKNQYEKIRFLEIGILLYIVGNDNVGVNKCGLSKRNITKD